MRGFGDLGAVVMGVMGRRGRPATVRQGLGDMSAALCLAGYGLVVGTVAPRWLSRVAGSGRAPRLAVAAWLIALATVGASLLAAAVALLRSPHAVLAGLGGVALAAAATRAGWA